jgi:hypothetical protein
VAKLKEKVEVMTGGTTGIGLALLGGSSPKAPPLGA